MAAQVGGSIVSPTTRTRLATLMGFSPEPSPRHEEHEDWFIPYNGPIEPPRIEGRPGRARAASNATRKSYSSSQGTRSFYGGGGIGEAPVNSTRDRASTFGTRDRASTYSTRDRISTYSTRDRASTYSTRDRDHMSTYSRDVDWEQHDKERETRGSIGSFLTFGKSARKSVFVFPKGQQPRRSEESRGAVRSSDELATNAHRPHTSQRPAMMFSPAAVGKSRPGTARESMEVSGAISAETPERQPAYGSVESQDEENVDFGWDPKPQLQERDTVFSDTQPMRHPYAVAFPTAVHEPRRHLPLPTPVTYSHTPKRSQSITHSQSTVSSNLPQAPKNNTLRARAMTVSSPNLRGRFVADKSPSGEEKSKGRKPSLRKMQYAAESWCDALLFPRPRFRAHIVSPPESPEEKKDGVPSVLRRTVSANEKPEKVDYFTTPHHRTANPTLHPDLDPPISSTVKSRQPAPVNPIVPASFASVSASAEFSPVELSPAEETMSRVLAEGAKRDKEREEWSEVARMSFQNRRSRSLSRTRSRKRSGPSRIRVESDAGVRKEAQGLGGLAVGLAAEAFRQPTPTISVSKSRSISVGSNAHSRNESGSGSGSGHGHNTALSKVAVKLTALDGAAASPEEKLEGALMSETTARMIVRGRREEAAEADVQFVDIAPMALPNGDRSRTHSQVSDSLDVPIVGIAISTPPPPSPLPDLSTHPYAQSSHHMEPFPISASYAGPHPTSFDYARPQRHSQVDAHPPQSPVDVHPPVPPVDTRLQDSPGQWERGAYAYADVAASDKRESALGVEEVLLSRTFQRGADNVTAFGSMDDYYDMPLPKRESTPPPPVRVRRKPVPLNTDTHSGIPSLSHTISTATHTDVPDAELPIRAVVRESSTALSSPTSLGSVSTSPRPIDDLESFRDLFYKPSIPRLSSEARRARGESVDSWSEDRIRSSEGLSGLRALTRRHRSYESSLGKEQDEGSKQRVSQGPYLDGVQEVQLGPSASPLPGLNGEPLQLGTPLRAEYEKGQNFPEDIESSRASSIIEHESVEETLRLGTVPLAVPETTKNERRQSTTLSIGDTEDGGSLRPNRSTVATVTSSLGIPATVEDLVRTSFTTTTSSTSRMSNLIGDFPIPPLAAGITPLPPVVLDSYINPPPSDAGAAGVVSDAVSE